MNYFIHSIVTQFIYNHTQPL